MAAPAWLLRVVLRGVLYRSGSPSDTAMTQLCLGGWQRVYSLYGDRTTMRGPRNAAMVEHGIDERRCETPAGERRLPWQPALAAARPKTLPLIFKDVVAAVRDPAQGRDGIPGQRDLARLAAEAGCGAGCPPGAMGIIRTRVGAAGSRLGSSVSVAGASSRTVDFRSAPATISGLPLPASALSALGRPPITVL